MASGRIRAGLEAVGYRWLLMIAGFGVSGAVTGQEGLDPGEVFILPETVVSASYVPVRSQEIGSSVSVVTEEELERRQTRFVSDVLRDVPGISVSRSGPGGTLTQVRIRGAEANHTLVLIDGVEVNNPAADGGYDFANLLAGDVQRIEVLRGPQSAIWGSDALGGVVNITTKRARPGLRLGGYLEGGSFNTTSGNAYLSGAGERFNLAVSGTFYNMGGINISRFGSEDDDYNNKTLNVTGGVRPLDNLDIAVSARKTRARDQFDPQDFSVGSPTQGFVIDGNERLKTDQTQGRGQVTLTLFEGLMENILAASYARTDTDNFSDAALTNSSEGTRKKINYQANLFLSTPQFPAVEHTLTFYGEREIEDFRSVLEPPSESESQKRSATNDGLAAEYRVNLGEQVFLSGSIRHDDNELFKNSTTYRATGAYLHPDWGTRVHGSVGTGVKNPTFTELFGFFPSFFVGNPDLKPEESLGWDLGVEQSLWGGMIALDATYFNTDLNDEIVTVFDTNTFLSTAVNQTGKSKRQGVELSARASITRDFDLVGAYTYTDSEDPDGSEEVRRPKHVGSLVLNWSPLGGRANVNLSGQYNGSMKDTVFIASEPSGRASLSSYLLVNLAASYQVTDSMQVYGRLDNLLDENYEDVFSFRAPGRAAYVGLRIGLERPVPGAGGG